MENSPLQIVLDKEKPLVLIRNSMPFYRLLAQLFLTVICLLFPLLFYSEQRCTADPYNFCQSRTITHIIVIQEHAELSHTNPEISFVELVRNVPAQRSKLPSFLDNTVKET